jgi:hypothetical protein
MRRPWPLAKANGFILGWETGIFLQHLALLILKRLRNGRFTFRF